MASYPSVDRRATGAGLLEGVDREDLLPTFEQIYTPVADSLILSTRPGVELDGRGSGLRALSDSLDRHQYHVSKPQTLGNYASAVRWPQESLNHS